MTDPLPAYVRTVFFDGGPLQAFPDDDAVREFLADVMEDDAERYQVWAISSTDTNSADRTEAFCEAWAECFEPGSGDDRETILRDYPDFIRAFIGDKLIAAYRAAQEAA